MMRHPPDAETTHLFLVRHGATEANERRPYILQGSGLNGDLSPTGQQQALAVGRFLGDFHVDHIYSSPMLRAMTTARAIAAAHALPVTPVKELTECNVGRWEGLDWDTIMRDHLEDHRKFVADPAVCPHPGGESYQDVLERCQPVILDLLEKHRGEAVVIVAHNMVNRVYLATLLGIELKRARDLRQSNCCVNFIRYHRRAAQVVTLNSIFHLDETLL